MKKILFLSLALAIVVLFSTTNLQAITIGFSPVSQDVTLGNPAVVDLVISGLGDYASPSLWVFNFDILYDPAILSFSSYTLGSYLGNILLGEAWDLSRGEVLAGDINLAELSLLLPDELNILQPESFSLATLTFDTLALGTSPLSISVDPLIGQGFVDENDNWLTVTSQTGSVNVVPEPATLILVGSGLAGIGFWRRKNQIYSK